MERKEVLRVIEEAARNELTELDLSNNQLETLPAEIGQLKNLTALNLAANQLKTLPAEIEKLKNLTTLYLSGNQLTSLPAEIVAAKKPYHAFPIWKSAGIATTRNSRTGNRGDF